MKINAFYEDPHVVSDDDVVEKGEESFALPMLKSTTEIVNVAMVFFNLLEISNDLLILELNDKILTENDAEAFI